MPTWDALQGMQCYLPEMRVLPLVRFIHNNRKLYAPMRILLNNEADFEREHAALVQSGYRVYTRGNKQTPQSYPCIMVVFDYINIARENQTDNYCYTFVYPTDFQQ